MMAHRLMGVRTNNSFTTRIDICHSRDILSIQFPAEILNITQI